MLEIITRLVPLPLAVRAFTVKGIEEYNIYVNSELSAEMQQKAFMHELDHINHNDFTDDTDILRREVEMNA